MKTLVWRGRLGWRRWGERAYLLRRSLHASLGKRRTTSLARSASPATLCDDSQGGHAFVEVLVRWDPWEGCCTLAAVKELPTPCSFVHLQLFPPHIMLGILRFFLASCVVVFHMSGHAPIIGVLAVNCFYVISGYLMTLVFE